MNYKITNNEPEYLKASNVVFAVVGVKLLTYVFNAITQPIGIFASILSIISVAITLGIWGGLALILRNRIDWSRYVLAVLAGLSVISTVISLFSIMEFPVVVILGLIATGLTIWAALIVLKKELNRV